MLPLVQRETQQKEMRPLAGEQVPTADKSKDKRIASLRLALKARLAKSNIQSGEQ
jgi:hypothetical protein